MSGLTHARFGVNRGPDAPRSLPRVAVAQFVKRSDCVSHVGVSEDYVKSEAYPRCIPASPSTSPTPMP